MTACCGIIEKRMALFKPGDVVPKTGFYQCIFCRTTVLCLKGHAFPPCKGGCPNPAYAYTKKDAVDL